jgi:nucleoside-diphosphate-sugar epimerase
MPVAIRALRRPVLLIVGCGDVGLRVLRLVRQRWRVLALTSSPERMPALRAAGAQPVLADLDDAATLRRLAGLADAVLHLAPPPGQGAHDPRTRHLLQALARGSQPSRLVYASTTGVYGHCGGAQFDESRPVSPATDRARRRVDAERQCRQAGRMQGVSCSVLRIPGIYAADREGGRTRDRVARGAPVLVADEDVYTNHIHADDLARACVAALYRGAGQRSYHVCDDGQLKMGEHFDAVADHFGLPRPPRRGRAELAQQLSPMQLSFMGESRRLVNTRLKQELRLSLRFPTVAAALAANAA